MMYSARDMNTLVRRWLDPMPTTLAPGFRPKDPDRSIDEQVASGFLIVAWIIGSIAVIALLGTSLRNLRGSATAFGCLGAALAALVLFLTAHRWAWLLPSLPFISGLRGPIRVLEALATRASGNLANRSAPCACWHGNPGRLELEIRWQASGADDVDGSPGSDDGRDRCSQSRYSSANLVYLFVRLRRGSPGRICGLSHGPATETHPA